MRMYRHRHAASSARLRVRCRARGCARPAPAPAQNFGPPELIEAAKKEGKVVYYTADFAEVEQEIIKAFNKRFPFVKVEMVRAPGGQLITRIKTEAAAGKLSADVINHSDRGLMPGLQDLFQDYAPPNAADYREDVQVSPKLWPRSHARLVDRLQHRAGEEPAQVLDGPDQARVRQQADRPGDRARPAARPGRASMFERQVLGEDYWKKQAADAAALYPSGAPLSDALVRGEVSIAPLLYNVIYTKKKDGAPVEIFFPPEGVPLNMYARRHHQDGRQSQRRQAVPQLVRCRRKAQTFMIKELGYLTALKNAAGLSAGLRSQGGQALGAELRAVREAARRAGSRSGTRPTAIGSRMRGRSLVARPVTGRGR